MAENILFELWNNYTAFTTFTVMMAAALAGLGSRSMAVGAYAAYLVFVQIAIKSQNEFMVNILYVTLILIILGMGFKLWRLELGGE